MAATRASSWIDMLGGVVSESKRVVAAHTRHFLALSVLFLLPLSSILVFSPSLLLFFPSLNPDPTAPPQSLLRSPPSNLHISFSAAAIALLYFSAILLLSLSAAAAVTHSVQRGFFGRPVKLLPALRSLPSSLFRLLLTLLAALLPIFAFLTIIASLPFLSLRALSPSSSFAIALTYSIAGFAAAVGLIYLNINWSLAGVIAILESSWGFEPLRRSTDLIRGMRWAALCLDLFFATGLGLILRGFSLGGVRTTGLWSEVVPVVARTIFGSAVIAVLLLYCLVTNAVLYMYCKALHGELAVEIAEEFAWEYVCLPFDDQKVPHVVSVVRQ